MTYRCVAGSVVGFVQQLAVGYIANGYYFYVPGVIPLQKDPQKTDRKILEAYGIEVSRWSRARRKLVGQASVQYLRCDRFYVIIATHGVHPFFDAEAKNIHDIHKRPILFQGYSIGCRRERGGGAYHASVRINREVYQELKAQFEQMAVNASVETICRELSALPYEPYAPVRTQYLCLLRAINRRRAVAGLEAVPRQALRLRRSPVRPFEARTESNESAVRFSAQDPTEFGE
jgi:hypothetical protein